MLSVNAKYICFIVFLIRKFLVWNKSAHPENISPPQNSDMSII